MPKDNQGISANEVDLKIQGIPVLEDNIIWILVVKKLAIVVDPALTRPVNTWLKENELELLAILQTHHHEDHIGGTPGLLKLWPKAEVVASFSDLRRIPFQTISVSNEDEISLEGSDLDIKVLGVPGHTQTHLAYYIPTSKKYKNNPILFCGDTLFGGGCGRLFEGTAKDMYNSLKSLCSLPSETRVYCAHEYTENNLIWAKGLRPKDLAINERLCKVIALRRKGQLSLPSKIAEEKATNLFVRAKTIEELAGLRKHKDEWKSQ